MEVKNTRLPFSEEEMNDLSVALRESEELRILVRFLMKYSDYDLNWLRQTIVKLGLVSVRRAYVMCSESFNELNQ